MGGDALLLIAHFFFGTFVLILIEMDLFKCLKGCTLRKIPKKNKEIDMEDDVLREEERTCNKDCKDVIKMADFRKAYTTLVGKPSLAVERISFGLDYGECFALLGVNGAGKSTCFKSLTADTTPTSGNISIDGFDIRKQFAKARQLIGYCP